MTQAASQSKVVSIAVELPAALCELAAEVAFYDSVAEYCTTLSASLDLPLEIELAISAGRPDSRVRVAIGEHEVTRPLHEHDGADPAQLIHHTIFQCRDSLVTESTSRQVWSEWFPASCAADGAASLEGVVCLFQAAARHGLRIGRLRSLVTMRGAAAISREVAEEIFEGVAGSPDAANVRIFVSRAQYARCYDGDKPRALASESVDFAALLEAMTDGLFQEIGILYHLAPVEIDDRLEEPWFRIQLNDAAAPLAKGLTSNEFVTNDSVDRLALIDLKGAAAINPASGLACTIVSGGAETRQVANGFGLTTWGPEGYVILYTSAQIRTNAGMFVNLALIDLFVCQLAENFPDLIRDALGRFGRLRLTRILRLLATEQISLRDLRGILDGLLAIDGTIWADLARFIVFTPPVHFPCPAETGTTLEHIQDDDYADCVRVAMRRFITHKYVQGGNTLVVYLIDPAIEKQLTAPTPFSPEERRDFFEALEREVGSLPARSTPPVILVPFAVRRKLQRLIDRQFPRFAVLAYQELVPDVNIQPMARISLK